jgi:phage/plasmid primase-like uncharacterized protein
VASRYGARLRKSGGGEFVGPCPRCGGRDRFGVNVRKGIWNCRGCAKGGDVIALVQHLTGIDFAEAIELLTGEAWPAPQLAEVRHHRKRTTSADNGPLAGRIWRESDPIFATLAEVYLHARGIDLEQIPNIDDVLRFHAACPFGEAQRLPCLIALIRDVMTDAPIGIMRTALDEHGRKIDRLALGGKQGGAIKLWPNAAVTTGLVVGEGLETVAAAATRIEDQGTKLQPAWALIDAGNLRHFPPLPGIEHLTILVDNDSADQHGHHPGQEAAAACTDAWLKANRYVTELTPKVIGADFADLAAQDREPTQ